MTFCTRDGLMEDFFKTIVDSFFENYHDEINKGSAYQTIIKHIPYKRAYDSVCAVAMRSICLLLSLSLCNMLPLHLSFTLVCLCTRPFHAVVDSLYSIITILKLFIYNPVFRKISYRIIKTEFNKISLITLY